MLGRAQPCACSSIARGRSTADTRSDRKSTRLNSSHSQISYAVICLKNKQQLRSLQDWHVRYALQSVPGVAEVASLGGMIKQYQVQLDPTKLFNYGITVPDVVRALRESNSEVGGRVIEIAGHEHMIRGRGYITSVADIESIPVKVSKEGIPILLKGIADVAIGPDMRRGIA